MRRPQRPPPKQDFRPPQRRRPASPPSDTQPDAAARRQSEDDGPTRAMPTEQRPVIPQQRADWQAAPVQRERQAPETNSPPPPTPERDPDGKRVQPTPLETPARPFFAPEPPVIPPPAHAHAGASGDHRAGRGAQYPANARIGGQATHSAAVVRDSAGIHRV